MRLRSRVRSVRREVFGEIGCMCQRGEHFEKSEVCVKGWDNTTHHPHLILDWGYTPALTEEIPPSPMLAVLTRWELSLCSDRLTVLRGIYHYDTEQQ
jgi:hypothetical protein